jgi:hypothetical protein
VLLFDKVGLFDKRSSSEIKDTFPIRDLPHSQHKASKDNEHWVELKKRVNLIWINNKI